MFLIFTGILLEKLRTPTVPAKAGLHGCRMYVA
jgi:hypothetical protein